MALIADPSLKVAIVSGGTSLEASVSRSSAAGVERALLRHYPSTKNFELTSTLIEALQDFQPNVVFPVLHGPPGEDGTFQGLLEMMQLPYVGSDVHASALAMDKIAAKGLFANFGLPLAKQYILNRDQFQAQQIDACLAELGLSVVVKPVSQGSALGVTRTEGRQALSQAVADAFEQNARLLIEERIFGREVTVGVLERQHDLEAFPVIEILTPDNTWYDFDHRYTPGASTHVMPAELPDTLSLALQKAAVVAHRALGCRDLSRTDFIVDQNLRFVVLEVNSLPGMTATSLYPEGAQGLGLAFDELLIELVERAYRRR